jgi:glycosyltransferase A (GT-A) superfamily protein (DUF2064 family)
MNDVTVIVLAKECVPGRVKTRLHPPFSLADAARIAQGALDDTITAVAEVDADRMLCVQGSVPVEPGFRQVPQVDGGLDERIGAVIDSIDGAFLLIGMDTPQVGPRMLQATIDDWPDQVDAWFGPASDGGFWLLGMRATAELRSRLGADARRGDLVRGVGMSRDDTGAVQRARLVDAGLRVGDLPTLTDIDDVQTLRQVRPLLPAGGALERVLEEFGPRDLVGAASAPTSGEVTR